MAVAFVLGWLLVSASPASAHADLVSSDPGLGTVLDEAPRQIVLVFSAALIPTGDEATVTAKGGRLPGSVRVDAERVTFVPESTLPHGTIVVTWKAKTGDAHPRTGSVSFSVGAPDGAATESTMPMDHDMSGMAPVALPEAPLEVPDDRGWVLSQAVAKFFTFTALVLTLGGLVFLAFVHHGHPGETHWISYLVRRSSTVAMVFSLVEIFVGASWLAGATAWPWDWDAYLDFLAPPNGIGFALRLTGIALVLSAPLPELWHHTDRTVRADLLSVPLALVGMALVAVSVLFVGHSMTEATGPLGWIADSVHLLAAGAWAGGVLMLTLVIARRWARREHLDVVELVVRFSPVAAAGLVVLAVTGTVMGVMEVKTVGALGSTPFGRALVLKLLLVGVAAAIGGYNKYSLIPALDHGVDSDIDGHRRIIRTTRLEAMVMLAVVGATAFLVDAGQS